MSVENGGNHDKETMESNAREMFGLGMSLLREHSKQVRVAGFWKYRQLYCSSYYEEELIRVRMRVGEQLDKVRSIVINITGKFKESLRVDKVDIGGQETYRVHGCNTLDPVGSTLGDTFRDLDRAKKGFNVLCAIRSGIEAEKTAQKLAFGEIQRPQ